MGLATAQDLARLRPQLLRFAMLRLRDRSRAEDVVQDALLAALENMHRFAGQSSLGTWVGGILRHKIADALRAPVREEPLDVEYALVSAEDPEHELERSRLYDAIGRNLERLPEKSGRVFVMRYVLEMESEEICAMLAMSASSFFVTLHRARQRLRECPDLQGLAADAL
jgi:RNA polymerase sigma-70 factor, ECF subfamily